MSEVRMGHLQVVEREQNTLGRKILSRGLRNRLFSYLPEALSLSYLIKIRLNDMLRSPS